MSQHNQITVTDEGLKSLQEELEYLRNVKRKEVIEAIGEARALGDLSENSEYDEAKSEQAKVEGRITELEEMLKHVVVITNHNSDTVNVGSIVRVMAKWGDEDEEEVEYNIVGSTDSDPILHKISDQSPVGQALIGAKEGDTVHPEGHDVVLRVLNISR